MGIGCLSLHSQIGASMRNPTRDQKYGIEKKKKPTTVPVRAKNKFLVTLCSGLAAEQVMIGMSRHMPFHLHASIQSEDKRKGIHIRRCDRQTSLYNPQLDIQMGVRQYGSARAAGKEDHR
jgi:hypothetical protein